MTGFRRYSGALWLDEHDKTILGLPKGHIKVRIHHEMSEVEARRLNISENMVRENLTTPDLTYAVKCLIDADPKLSTETLSTMYAKSKSHMAAVVKVAKKLRDGTFNEWRQSPVKPLPIIEMSEIADKPKSEQEEAYKEALAAYSGKKEPDAKAWLNAAIRKAKTIGVVIGSAQRKGLITLNENAIYDDEDTELIRTFVKFRTKLGGKKVPNKTVGRVAKAFTDAYITAKNSEEDTDEDDGAEVID